MKKGMVRAFQETVGGRDLGIRGDKGLQELDREIGLEEIQRALGNIKKAEGWKVTRIYPIQKGEDEEEVKKYRG